MKSLFKLSLFCLLFFLPLTVVAELPPQVVADFNTLGGYIIMPVGDEYLVDLDSSQNLREGDILTIVTPGQKVIHPISKEILGSLDTPIGFLQVTRIKSGYSYAKLIVADKPPEKGGQIRRYEQVPVLFVDKQGVGESLRDELKSGLTQLNWLDDDSSNQALLLFTLENNRLSVKNKSGAAIYSYQYLDEQLIAKRLTATADPFAAAQKKPKLLERVADSVMGTFSSRASRDSMDLEEGIRHQAQRTHAGIWMSPSLKGNPIGIAVSDFSGDGQLETVVAFENNLEISRIVNDEYKPIATVDIPKNLKLLSLESADLDNNGSKELYLSALNDEKLSSLVIEYSSGTFQITIDKIGWFLRSVDYPDQGTVLIGQRKGGLDEPFYGQPFQVLKEGNKLIAGETIPLPGLINLYAFVPFKDDQGQLLYAYLDESDYLHVMTAGGNSLWESGDYFGGSEAYFDPKPLQKGNDDIIPRVYIRQRLLSGPAGEIIVSQNDGLRTLQRFRKFKSSRLVALKWNGFAMDEQWRTSEQQGYLGDFTVADANNDGNQELVMAIKYKHKGLIQKATSSIVTYELN